jgi:hypothetical protein
MTATIQNVGDGCDDFGDECDGNYNVDDVDIDGGDDNDADVFYGGNADATNENSNGCGGYGDVDNN